MNRPGMRTVSFPAFLALAIVGAAPAGAQYLPPAPPDLPEILAPPGPYEDPDPPADDAEDAARPAVPEAVLETGERLGWGWDHIVVAEGAWENNVGFTSPPSGDDFFGDLRLSISPRRRSPRSDWQMLAEGAAYVYAQNTHLNRLDFRGALSGQFEFSRQVSGGLRAGYSYGHTDTDYSLTAAGTVLPPARMKTATFGGGALWRLGERTSLALDAGGYDDTYDSDILVDSQTLYADATLQRRLGPAEDVFLGFRYRRTDSSWVTHDPGVEVGYGRRLTSGLRLGLSGGANRPSDIDGAGSGSNRWWLTGTARLYARIRRSSLGFSYEHQVQPTLGLGITEQSDVFALRASIPLGRITALTARGTLGLRGDPGEASSPRRRDLDFFVGASARLSRQALLIAGYRFRRSDDPRFLEPVRNDRASLTLVWGPEASSWR